MLPTTFAACRLRGAARFDRDLTSAGGPALGRFAFWDALSGSSVCLASGVAACNCCNIYPRPSLPPLFLFLQWREVNHEMRRRIPSVWGEIIVTPREVGEEGMKGIGSLIGAFAVPVGDSRGWAWIPRSCGDATRNPRLGSGVVWTTEKDDYRHVYTARSRASASASASASDRILIGVFSERKHHAAPA